MFRFNFQRGISLLELLLSLVVITAILFAATRYFSITSENLKVTQAEEMINNVANASFQWVQGYPDFSSLISIQTLIDAKLLPDNYSSITINPWRGSITVRGWPYDTSYVQIIMNGVPVASCKNLLRRMQHYISEHSNCQGDFSPIRAFSVVMGSK